MDYSPLDRAVRVFARIIIVAGLLVMLSPIITTIGLSFGKTLGFPPSELTLDWYVNFLSRTDFIDGLRVSVVLALSTVVVATTVGTGIALTLTRHAFRGRAALNFLILSPIAVPRVASGVALFLLFIAIGVRTAPLRLFAVHALLACPYVVAVVTASLQGLDPRLEEAAMNLGASPWETFRRVTLPLIRPGIVTGAIFAFITSFDEVTASVFLIDVRTTTFPVVLFSYLARGSTDPTIAAASSFMLLFVMGLVLIIARSVGLGRALGVLQRS